MQQPWLTCTRTIMHVRPMHMTRARVRVRRPAHRAVMRALTRAVVTGAPAATLALPLAGADMHGAGRKAPCGHGGGSDPQPVPAARA
jgi:hypothetical protein